MSVTAKLSRFGRMKGPTLIELQMKAQEEMFLLKDEIMKKNKAIIEARNEREKSKDLFDDDLVKDEESKLKLLEEERNDLREQYKDDLETVKTIEQILKIREEKKTAHMTRVYSGLGTVGVLTGIGLAYGADTWGTLINKKTLDAVKIVMSRAVPKLI